MHELKVLHNRKYRLRRSFFVVCFVNDSCEKYPHYEEKISNDSGEHKKKKGVRDQINHRNS